MFVRSLFWPWVGKVNENVIKFFALKELVDEVCMKSRNAGVSGSISQGTTDTLNEWLKLDFETYEHSIRGGA